MSHVSLDLETLGLRPGCVLRSIGAVVFDPLTGALGAEFYVNISRSSCEDVGLITDPKTLAWWEDQSPEARARLETDQVDVLTALDQFAAWWLANGCEQVWGYGSNFDVAVLEEAYRVCGFDAPPWTYKGARCGRTLCALADTYPDRLVGVLHDALDDAKNQAAAFVAAYGRLAAPGVAA